MAIVGGLDIHRRQITYDWIDTDTGETCRGQLSPATRVTFEIAASIRRLEPARRVPPFRTTRWSSFSSTSTSPKR